MFFFLHNLIGSNLFLEKNSHIYTSALEKNNVFSEKHPYILIRYSIF